MNLLIVEDNDQMRRMIVRVVRSIATRTCECRDGAEALPATPGTDPTVWEAS